MPGTMRLASLLDGGQTEISDDVGLAQTLGYRAGGDGGGALFRRAAREPVHDGKFRSADGAWWEITGAAFDARQFGAVGDGVHDDSGSIQSALSCPLVLALNFGPGRYRTIGLRLERACSLSGQAAELFWDDPSETRGILTIDAPSAVIEGLSFGGVRYVDHATAVGPHTLLRIDPLRPRDDGEVRLSDLTFVGGRMACVIGLVSNIFIDRVRFERCRDYALVLARGPRRIVVNGLTATQIGQYGGVKMDFAGTARATEKFVLNSFVISDCGRIEADPALWQEGLDLICGFAREFVITNGVISDCGNGGIELKTGNVIIDEDDDYSDILISGVTINTIGNHHGIVMNWTGPKGNSPKRGQRVVITNNIVRHSQATNSEGCGVMISAWSDILISNNYIDGACVGVNLSPRGSSNDCADRLQISHNRMRNVRIGVYAPRGEIFDIDVSHNCIYAEEFGICLSGAKCQEIGISHNKLFQGYSKSPTTAAIFLRNCRDVEVWSNRCRAEDGYGIFILGEEYGPCDGKILNNFITSRLESCRIEGGRWEILENQVRVKDRSATVLAGPDARVEAAWNVRGARLQAPSGAAAPGDTFLSAASDVNPPMGWWFHAPDHPHASGSWRTFGREIDPPSAWGPVPTRRLHRLLTAYGRSIMRRVGLWTLRRRVQAPPGPIGVFAPARPDREPLR